MIKQLYENAHGGIETRQALSKLRALIKEEGNRKKLAGLAMQEGMGLELFFASEDAKTRKNAALLMGELGNPIYVPVLVEQYQKEPQLFVKASYLSALKQYDVRKYTDFFKAEIERLTKEEITVENKKHVEEQLRELTELVVLAEGIHRHHFTGFQKPVNIILLTNRLHREVTQQQILDGKLMSFHAGVHVLTDNIRQFEDIRTYSEMLFGIEKLGSCDMDPVRAAGQIADSPLLSMLESSHDGKAPYYFRVELKTGMELDQKSAFVKKFASALEQKTNRKLINSPGEYEFEIRLIETKEATFNVLLKMYTVEDHRFDYRREYVASSIKPVNAAIMVELAKEYMVSDAQVLDPFCGVGTMLIERQKVVKANTSYGIDIYEPAIRGAKKNTELAEQIIHFINRDFMDFTHEYLFDEIFTNMPFVTGHKSEEEIHELYRGFFEHAKKVLKEDGTIIMYSHNADFVYEQAKKQRYEIVKAIEIMRREKTWLFVVRRV